MPGFAWQIIMHYRPEVAWFLIFAVSMRVAKVVFVGCALIVALFAHDKDRRVLATVTLAILLTVRRRKSQ
jgi:hypothetical protein